VVVDVASVHEDYPRLTRVDVIYRRVDDEFIDPRVRSDSLVGQYPV